MLQKEVVLQLRFVFGLVSVMASLGRRKLLCCLVLLSMCICGSAQDMVLTLGDVFPFGLNEGDEELPTGNDEAETVVLQTPILYYGLPRFNITVSCCMAMMHWCHTLAGY